jgi:hypothetical protein
VRIHLLHSPWYNLSISIPLQDSASTCNTLRHDMTKTRQRVFVYFVDFVAGIPFATERRTFGLARLRWPPTRRQ